MKFWQKILIYSLLIFLAAFNAGAYFLIENSHKISMESEIDRSLREQRNIYKGVRSSVISVKSFMDASFDEDFVEAMVKKYMKTVEDKQAYMEILDEKDFEIYSNHDLDIGRDRPELKNPDLNRRSYMIRDIEDKTYLFVTSLIEADGEVFKFTYIRDISHVYDERDREYAFFIRLEALVALLMAAAMYALTRHLTRPVSELASTAKRIREGDYSQRIRIRTNDEIGELAEDFNDMARAIESRMEELEKAVGEKQRFIDNMTHELKTPLTSIIGYAQFLMSTKYDEENFQLGMGYILGEGKRLKNLSEKMMNLIMLKKENFVMKETDMKRVCEQAAEVVGLKLKRKNIRLEISGQERIELVEPELMKNMLTNFLDNSIKASGEGSRISIDLYEDENLKTVIMIVDEGKGMDSEDAKRAFEPFYTTDKSRSSSAMNVGLGLSICREIADMHKAEIIVKSQLGVGTSVKIIMG